MLEALLFDLDGLLVDSEPLQFRAYREALADYGVALDHDAWVRWHAVEASTARWVADQGIDLDVEAMRDAKKAIFDELVRNELVLQPGARELVEGCAQEFTLAVVSGSRIESIELCLRKFDLDGYFSELVSCVSLARSKPCPDAYLEALRRLDLPATGALALEDSVTGYRAATAAGLACVVCPDDFVPRPAGAFAGAAHVVDSLAELDPAGLRLIHDGGTTI